MLTEGNVGGEKDTGRNVRSRRIDEESQRSVFLRRKLKARAAVSGHVPFSLAFFFSPFSLTLQHRGNQLVGVATARRMNHALISPEIPILTDEQMRKFH